MVKVTEEDARTLKSLANKGTEGVVILGQVAESRTVNAGVDATGKAYDAYNKARVVTGLGESTDVKLPPGALPKVGEKYAFFISRVWRGQGGKVSAQADAFV